MQKRVELNTKIVSVALNTQKLNIIEEYTNVCVVKKITEKKFDVN